MKSGVIWIVTDQTSSVARVVIPSGKKVDITGYNIRSIPEGVVQNGIVYDANTLSEIFKSQLQKMVKDQEIGEVLLVIPGDRVKTAHLYLEGFVPGELSHSNVEQIEETFAAPLTKLRFFPEEETKNAYVFHGARSDIVIPYLTILEGLGLSVSSVLPSANCIRTAVKKLVTSPTIIVYEHNGLHLFSASPNTTVTHKLWSVDKLREDQLRAGVEEMSKDTEKLIGVKPDRVLVIESDKLGGEKVENLLGGMDIKLAFFSPQGSEYISPIDMLTIKGMLTSALVENESGFAHSPIDAYQLKVEGEEAKLIKSGGGVLSKDYKVAFLSTLLAVVMLVIGLSVLWEFYLKDKHDSDLARKAEQETTDAVAEEDNGEDVMGAQSLDINLPKETVEENELPVAPVVAKSEVAVTVLNGNGLPGEAKTVARLIQAGGFKIAKTGNADNYNYAETIIIAPPDLADFADEIKGLVIGDYALAHVETHEGLTPKVIVVVIGAQ